jgi:tetratricopeptide (TPR) repeat protein
MRRLPLTISDQVPCRSPVNGCKPAWKSNVTVGLGETYEENFKLYPGDDYVTFWELSHDMTQGKTISDASALMDEGKYAESIIKAQKILIAMYALIGENNMKLGKFEEARKAYENALKYQANNPDLLMNLGVVLTKLVRKEEAQEVFKRAAEANRARASKLLGGSGVD